LLLTLLDKVRASKVSERVLMEQAVTCALQSRFSVTYYKEGHPHKLCNPIYAEPCFSLPTEDNLVTLNI
jgi:hypothetical protein